MRKTKTAALALCIGMTLGMPAWAVSTFGDRSCGQWIAARTEGGVAGVAALNWLTGFASGYVIGRDIDPFKGVDVDTILLYTDNYCRANPLNLAVNAIVYLVADLQKRRQ